MNKKTKILPFWVIEENKQRNHGPFATVHEASAWAKDWIGYESWRVTVDVTEFQGIIHYLSTMFKA